MVLRGEPILIIPAALAQLVERLTRNEKVAGSIPAGGPNEMPTDLALIAMGCVTALGGSTGRFWPQKVGATLDRQVCF